MSIAQYPTPFVAAHPSEPAGPPILILQRLPTEFPGSTERVFKDGGATYAVANTSGVIRWDLSYDGLWASEVAALDTHHDLAFGSGEGFDFRDPRTGVLYNNVHYESYEYPQHTQYDIQARHVVLIKRPG